MAAALALLLVAVLLVVVLFAARHLPAYRKFRRLELAIPGPPSLPLLGNTLDFVGATDETVMDILLRLGANTPELSRISGPGFLFLIVTDPEHIELVFKGKTTQQKSRFFYKYIDYFSPKNIIGGIDGQKNRTLRRIIQPAFHAEVLDRFTGIFAEECEAFIDRCNLGVAQDIMYNSDQAFFSCFVRTMLTDQPGDEGAVMIKYMAKHYHEIARAINERSFSVLLDSEFIFRLTRTYSATREHMRRINAFFKTCVEQRRAALRARKADNDFISERRSALDLLVAAEPSIPDDEICDHLAVLMGGSDEASSAFTWVLKVLSVRQDIQRRVHQELEDVVGPEKEVATHLLSRLEYLERVIKETLRLVPVQTLVCRTNTEEMELGGYTIPRKSNLVINIHGCHRHPRHWPDPLVFDPDRFLPERVAARHPCAYLPFGLGQRNCIGAPYAMQSVTAMLATLLLRCHVHPVDDGHNDPAAFPQTFRIGTVMTGGTWVTLTARTS